MNQDILKHMEGIETKWCKGFGWWRFAYYSGNVVAISFPALLTANFLFLDDKTTHKALAVASVIIAILNWLHTGEKATAHEHAYLCLRTLIIKYKANLISDDHQAMKEFEDCSRYIDYPYADRELPRLNAQAEQKAD